MHANSSVQKEKPIHTKLTVQERRAHVQAYLASQQSLPSYSQEHNIPKSTLYTWIKMYPNESTNLGSFIPVALPSLKNTPIIKPHKQEIHIMINPEFKLVIPELVDISAVVKLIQALSPCN